MNYPSDLEDFDFRSLKTELHEKIADHRTVDQQREVMVRSLRTVLSRMILKNKNRSAD